MLQRETLIRIISETNKDGTGWEAPVQNTTSKGFKEAFNTMNILNTSSIGGFISLALKGAMFTKCNNKRLNQFIVTVSHLFRFSFLIT